MLTVNDEHNSLKVSIHELLRFFDEAPPESAKHATAVAAVLGEDLGGALVKHYCERLHNTHVEILFGPDNRPLSVTTGRLRGPRLDRWIKITSSDKTIRLFQAEVKNWSAHATGGQRIEITAEPEQLSERARDEWGRIVKWLGGPVNPINKVLVPMAFPVGNPSAELSPLLIFWDVIQSEGKIDECLFWHALNQDQHPDGYGNTFDRLAVFSMSLYLRRLLAERETEVTLQMPDTASRMQWLNAILRA